MTQQHPITQTHQLLQQWNSADLVEEMEREGYWLTAKPTLNPICKVNMSDQHPVTPSPQLRRLWAQEAQQLSPHDPVEWMQYVSEKAAQWGSDKELEACCEWLKQQTLCGHRDLIPSLHIARRPKPPSLKEQALEIVRGTPKNSAGLYPPEHVETIRRALEQLDD